VNDALVEHVGALPLELILEQLQIALRVDHNRSCACKEMDLVIPGL
jgi:hypothetical protein